MFESTEALVDDLRAFATDPSVAAIPFSFASHESGAGLLQLAAGRTPASLGSRGLNAHDFEAARGFLAYVVFDAKNDYFTLLCVDRHAPDDAVKDNYRRLIALVHPDANPIGFPADAASRVNLGYSVLSNAEARSSYAESLERGPTISAFATKHHPIKANWAHDGPRPQRPSPSRRLFTWIKRPRFGFGLLALATILILPVVVILANMANDTGDARLISGREQSEQRQAALTTRTSGSGSTGFSGPLGESNPVLVTDTSSSTARHSASSRDGNSIRISSSVVAAAEPIKVTKAAPERGAVALSNGVPSPAASAAFEPQAASFKLSLAPVPSRLLDPSEFAMVMTDTRAPSVTGPQITVPALVDTAPHNKSSASAANQTALKGQPVAIAQNQPTVATRAVEARSRDSEDALLRFGNAYEQGSIGGVQALFTAAMPGRSQMIADYQRVFSSTRQRNIRFLQLKHTVTGQRVTTVGQAVVTTIGTDNKSSSQRVFLEIEVARDGNDVRIERMSNYALD